jgi:Tfp pilus assembly protein FimT
MEGAMFKNEKGKSLVEVMCCAAVVSILSLFSAPALSAIQEKLLVQTIISEYVADLQNAKISAIEVNGYVVVQVRADGYSIFVDDGSGGSVAGDYLPQPNEKRLIDKKLPPLVVVTSNFPQERFRFRGMPGNCAGAITLKVKGVEHSRIVISMAGRIRVEKV